MILRIVVPTLEGMKHASPCVCVCVTRVIVLIGCLIGKMHHKCGRILMCITLVPSMFDSGLLHSDW